MSGVEAIQELRQLQRAAAERGASAELAKLVAKIQRDKGERGPMGPQGPQGATGATGASGANGRSGSDGKAGERGLQGFTGASGKDGDNGVGFAKDRKPLLIKNERLFAYLDDGREIEVGFLPKAKVVGNMSGGGGTLKTIVERGSTTPEVRYTAIDTDTTDLDEVIVCTEELTVTLHTPTVTTPLKPKRIKRVGTGNVTVTTVDNDGYILNINYQAVDVQWTGTEWISL